MHSQEPTAEPIGTGTQGIKGKRLLSNAASNAASNGKNVGISRPFLSDMRQKQVRQRSAREHNPTPERLQLQDDDCPPINMPTDEATPDQDVEWHKPGHVPGKAVLCLALASVWVPFSGGPSSTERGAHQIIICSGGHDGEVKLWRLQAQPRLFVGGEMCGQAPYLASVGSVRVPAPASSVFSLVHASPPAGSAQDGMLLVGEGKSRQLTCWRLAVDGGMLEEAVAAVAAAPRSHAPLPPLADASVVHPGALDELPPAVEQSSWGLRIDMDASRMRDEAEDVAAAEQGAQEAEDEHGGQGSADSSIDDSSMSLGPDGTSLIRLDAREVARVVDGGGWRVQGHLVHRLEALHTGWVRAVAMDAAHAPGAPRAYSVGCNYVKVWQLPPSPHEMLRAAPRW